MFNFISNLQIKGVKKRQSYCELDQQLYLAQTTMYNSIRVTSDPDIPDDDPKNKSICRITSKDIEKLQKPISYPYYFVDLLFEQKNPERNKFRDTAFYFEDDEIIILPDVTFFHTDYSRLY
jgi:hypothetical protein